MDTLWSPWRLKYIEANAAQTTGCVFCDIAHSANDEANLLLFRGKENFIILNLYPYTTGHLLIIPFEHVSNLYELNRSTTEEMMELAKQSQQAIRDIYQPQGFNLGMNFGRAAGAGIADHLHMHLLPRWYGDVNFMSSISNTRVIPEDLPTTYQKLKPFFAPAST